VTETAATEDPGTTVLGGILPARADLLEQAARKLRPLHFTGQVLPGMFSLLQRYLDMTGEVMTRAALAGFLDEQKAQAGTTALWLETYDLCASLPVSDGEFAWAVGRMRELASEQATGQALTEAYQILTQGAGQGEDRKVGPDAARLHVMERFAAIDADLNQADAPEGEVNAEEDQILDRYARTAYARKLAGGSPGISLGIPSVDAVLGGGLSRGELALFAGFSSSGKTSLCVQMAWHAKCVQGKNVVIFTSETLRHQVINKLVSRHSRHPQFAHEMPDGLDSARVRSGTLSGPEMAAFQSVVRDFTHNPAYGRCYLAQVPFGATIGQVRSRLERIGHLFPVDLFIVDYLQLLHADRRRDTSHEEAAQMVKDAKAAASTFSNGLGVPMVSPWQVNRSGRDRALKEGGYSGIDLAGTAEAFNTPDVVLTLLEPAKIENPRSCPVKGELLKNRDGPRGSDFPLKIDYATSWFRGGEDDFASGSDMFSSAGGIDFGSLV
jgi:replicative DNA helicase